MLPLPGFSYKNLLSAVHLLCSPAFLLSSIQSVPGSFKYRCGLLLSAKEVKMAVTGLSSRAGIWGPAIVAMLLCSQLAVVWADDSGGCSNGLCDDENAYAPKHFILVHGMAGAASFWFEIITMLEQRGSKATAVDLTSHGINKAVADDITTLAQYSKPLTDAIGNAPGQVILVGHSLAGGVIAYASELFPTKVSKAIYLSAISPSYGQSMFGSFPPNTLPSLINRGFLTFNFNKGPSTPSSAVLSVSAVDQYYMTETAKRYISMAKLVMTVTPYVPGTETLPLTMAKYGTVRRFYIRTGKDKTLFPADQDVVIATNPPEKVFCMPGGDHAVFFSAPMELTKLLMCISGQ